MHTFFSIQTWVASCLLAIPALALAETPQNCTPGHLIHSATLGYYVQDKPSSTKVGEIILQKRAYLTQLAQKNQLSGFKISQEDFYLVSNLPSAKNANTALAMHYSFTLEYDPNYAFLTALSRESDVNNLVVSITDPCAQIKKSAATEKDNKDKEKTPPV